MARRSRRRHAAHFQRTIERHAVRDEAAHDLVDRVVTLFQDGRGEYKRPARASDAGLMRTGAVVEHEVRREEWNIVNIPRPIVGRVDHARRMHAAGTEDIESFVPVLDRQAVAMNRARQRAVCAVVAMPPARRADHEGRRRQMRGYPRLIGHVVGIRDRQSRRAAERHGVGKPRRGLRAGRAIAFPARAVRRWFLRAGGNRDSASRSTSGMRGTANERFPKA
jgi:hypothetical protein